VVVAFRGTFSLRNWFTNFRIRAKGGCHRGISEAVDYHLPSIKGVLMDVPWSHLWITGHSLGGAMAVEAGRRLWDEGFHDMTVVTFGAVRGHTRRRVRGMAGSVAKRCVRVVNNNDLVARLLGISYKHVGRVLYFDRRGRWHRHLPWAAKLWDAVAGRVRNPLTDGVGDHDMDDYIRLCAGMPMSVEEYLN
jgi:hypothetical protein